ncbi:hypothetical protein B0H17DRAFT_932423 [Mycena rosella]|uniref:Uncharacterized protein n=1 Tax=Mycena rosella TaxID=1033263 RepID=A0AAD7DLB4_MYCRO|nr:hypothetical protein B0H17DRAFT_932423 [Mycena rosella]
MEVITSIGTYLHKERGHIIFWEDDKVIELPSGASVMFPAGTKRYSFIPMAANEERFLIRQFCHAGVLRWGEKGGRSDSEFEALASPVELEAWNEKQGRRAEASAKMFSKVVDIFVF